MSGVALERTFARLARFRHLIVCCRRRAGLHLALQTLARALICLQRIRRFLLWLALLKGSRGFREEHEEALRRRRVLIQLGLEVAS